MDKNKILKLTEDFVREKMVGEGTGHDYYHVLRVASLAELIAKKENKGNVFVIKLAALLHDIADWKFHNGDESIGPKIARNFLESAKLDKSTILHVTDIIATSSFKGGKENKKMKSIEGQIVQDADRLDALGAIGIARCFAYGGFKKRAIYDPNVKPKKVMSSEEYVSSDSPSINHFYEKLLKLRDLMNTKTGNKIAVKRHRILENFLSEFYKEWDVKI